MPVKLKFLLFLCLAACFAGYQAKAQDEGQPLEVQEFNQQHPELNLNDDKTLLMEVEKAPKTPSATHEAPSAVTTNNSAAKAKSDNSTKSSSSEKTEEDPLSFNFLYFIIQKFKISDIVDD